MSQRVHVVGIGGVGTSSLAAILAQSGATVTGSEDSRTILAGELLERFPQIRVFDGFSPSHLDGIDWVIHTVAASPDNPELVEAARRGIPVSTYPQALGRFLSDAEVCGVAGTHGKTTTTAMIASAFEAAGLPVSYLVGAPLQGGLNNARYTPGSAFVLESDEYRGAFMDYAHRFAQLVITNIDFDHPDYYPSQDAVEKAFSELLTCAPPAAYVVACGDSAGVRAVVRVHDRIITYGFDPSNAVRVGLAEATRAGSTFSVTGPSGGPVTLHVTLPGRHNVLNATAAYLAARQMGCPVPAIASALASCAGARRRFDIRLSTPQVAVVDDYAHHPAAVASFVDGLRQRYPGRRLVLVFQPHTLTRTRALFDDFVTVLRSPRQVAVLDVYAGRESDNPAEPGRLAARLREALRSEGAGVLDAVEPAGVVAAVAELAAGEPVVIGTVGAGDLWKTVTEPLVARLGQEAAQPGEDANRSSTR
jgi:UDP-N-acetylmuramate--alanine ligase